VKKASKKQTTVKKAGQPRQTAIKLFINVSIGADILVFIFLALPLSWTLLWKLGWNGSSARSVLGLLAMLGILAIPLADAYALAKLSWKGIKPVLGRYLAYSRIIFFFIVMFALVFVSSRSY